MGKAQLCLPVACWRRPCATQRTRTFQRGAPGAEISCMENQENTFLGDAHQCSVFQKIKVKVVKSIPGGRNRHAKAQEWASHRVLKTLSCFVLHSKTLGEEGPRAGSGEKPSRATVLCKKDWTLSCKQEWRLPFFFFKKERSLWQECGYWREKGSSQSQCSNPVVSEARR